MSLIDDSSHDAYHTEMQAKIANMLDDNKYNDGMDADDASVESARVELDVPSYLPGNCLDHIIIATSDFDSGLTLFKEMTGLEPGVKTTWRGGAGVKSSLVALDNQTFLEIVGPDAGGMASDFKNIPNGKLVPYHYAVRTSDPEEINIPDDLKWEKDNVTMIGNDTTKYDEDGGMNKWDFIYLYGHGLGGVAPSYVHWRENKGHPTAILKKQGAKLTSVEISAPSGHYVHTLLSSVNGVDVTTGSPKLTFTIQTPKGAVTFSGSNPNGIVMPGFDDTNHESYNRGK
jgi:Glyoxalase-like domain